MNFFKVRKHYWVCNTISETTMWGSCVSGHTPGEYEVITDSNLKALQQRIRKFTKIRVFKEVRSLEK